MRTILLLTSVFACACPPKPTSSPTNGQATGGQQGSAVGSGSGGPVATQCDEVKGRVEDLYRVEAQQNEPRRVEEAVADNTAMVMADCARQPQIAVPCLETVATVAQLEKQCLVPIDDEGTEGER
jgi:outer membrane lipoprotein SlyB